VARRRLKPKQTEFVFRRRGGRRPGAGRKRGPLGGPGHAARPEVVARHPLHVTLKMVKPLRSLRTKKKAKAIRAALVQGCLRDGFRVVDWSIQADHMHLIVEASSKGHLSRGMQGLTIRIARKLNRALGRKGKVFAQRFHARALTTPREVRNARAYVLLNARRHAAQQGRAFPRRWVDPFSSWAHCDGWRDCPKAWIDEARDGPEKSPPVAPAESWLLRAGWRRHGLIRIAEVPGRC
jgi:REP element-mobilizing transposase RayT